jgi:large repetitive protein
MHPRHLTGLPGNFFAGARLERCLAALLSVGCVLLASQSWAASNVLEYTFDPAGNITRISRVPTGQIAITSFSPSSGAVGTAVTVYGMGFSSTPANNTVKFNGTIATVTASDAGSIATTVPSGATTGKITVTIGATTVTSAQDFTVTVAGAPTIASFTPAIGATGTSVSLTGTGFNATAGATTFKLNGVTATGDAASTTAAALTIPASASSGRITATTSIGTGASTSDFIVPPAGLVAGDIETITRISAGGAAGQPRIGTPNRAALVLFDGTMDVFYSLHFTALELSPTSGIMSYKVIKPDNSVLLSSSMLMTQPHTVHLPRLPANGTYTLQLTSGTATLNTLVRLEQNPVLTLDGAAIATNQDYPSQTSRFIFTATAGQRIGIGVLGLSLVPGGSGVALKYQKEDQGSTSRTCFTVNSSNPNGNCGAEFLAASAGTYFITLGDLAYRTTASVQISSPASAALVKDTTQAVSLARVGQHTAHTFAASAGDNVGVNIFAATAQSPVPKLHLLVRHQARRQRAQVM